MVMEEEPADLRSDGDGGGTSWSQIRWWWRRNQLISDQMVMEEDPADLRSAAVTRSPRTLPRCSSIFSREAAKFPVLCMFLETWRPASAAVLSGVFGCEVSVKSSLERHVWCRHIAKVDVPGHAMSRAGSLTMWPLCVSDRSEWQRGGERTAGSDQR